MSGSILWVDDNPSDVLLLSQAFKELVVAVDLVVAENAVQFFRYMSGREARRTRRYEPHLILVDLNLPVLSGARVLEEIRQHKPWAKVPVVVLTSSSDPTEVGACLRLGAVECMTKPHQFQGYLDVAARLKRYLPLSGSHQADLRPAPGTPSGNPQEEGDTNHHQVGKRGEACCSIA